MEGQLQDGCEALQAGGTVYRLVTQAARALGCGVADPVSVLLSQLVAELLPGFEDMLSKDSASYYYAFTYDAQHDCYTKGALSRLVTTSTLGTLGTRSRAELLQARGPLCQAC